MRYYSVRFKLFLKGTLTYDSRDTDYVRAKNKKQAYKLAVDYLKDWHWEWTDSRYDEFEVALGKSSYKMPEEYELIIW